MQDNRKKVSFMLNKDIIYKIKEKALKEDTTQSELIRKWIKKGLEEN